MGAGGPGGDAGPQRLSVGGGDLAALLARPFFMGAGVTVSRIGSFLCAEESHSASGETGSVGGGVGGGGARLDMCISLSDSGVGRLVVGIVAEGGVGGLCAVPFAAFISQRLSGVGRDCFSPNKPQLFCKLC